MGDEAKRIKDKADIALKDHQQVLNQAIAVRDEAEKTCYCHLQARYKAEDAKAKSYVDKDRERWKQATLQLCTLSGIDVNKLDKECSLDNMPEFRMKTLSQEVKSKYQCDSGG